MRSCTMLFDDDDDVPNKEDYLPYLAYWVTTTSCVGNARNLEPGLDQNFSIGLFQKLIAPPPHMPCFAFKKWKFPGFKLNLKKIGEAKIRKKWELPVDPKEDKYFFFLGGGNSQIQSKNEFKN